MAKNSDQQADAVGKVAGGQFALSRPVQVHAERPARFPPGTTLQTADGWPPHWRSEGIPEEPWVATLPSGEPAVLSLLEKAALISSYSDSQVVQAEGELGSNQRAIAELEGRDQVSGDEHLTLENLRRKVRRGEKVCEGLREQSLAAHRDHEREILKARVTELGTAKAQVVSDADAIESMIALFEENLRGVLDTHRAQVVETNKLEADVERRAGRPGSVQQGALGSPFSALNLHRDAVFSHEVQAALRQVRDAREIRAAAGVRRQQFEEEQRAAAAASPPSTD
jgi:hypothetical protein